jgi:acid phosphatase type 7
MRRVVGVLFLTACLSTALLAGASPPQQASALEGGDPVIAAAGDIACAPPATRTSSKCHQGNTAALLTAGGYDAVLPLGDAQYDCGELTAFNAVYDPSWGQVKSISHPIAGDNEYTSSVCSTPGASGYFSYFGDAASPQQPGCTTACKGYYSYDLGSWHLIALNSECSQTGVGGCGSTSAQGKWLKADLAAHATQCTLAYWHRPYWSDAGGTVSKTSYFAKTLYAAGAELLLVGHQHIYERFAPMNPSTSALDAIGLRQFIVGTGGKSASTLATTPPANAEVRNKGTYGVLKLTLHAGSYDWQFVPEAGKTFTDAGTQLCH